MSFDSGRVGRKIEDPPYALHDEEERSSIRKLDAHVEGVRYRVGLRSGRLPG